MSNIKVTPNHAGLAVSESISFFTEQWKSTLQHSDFYIVAVVDEHGTVQTIHDFKAGNVALAEPAPGISLWLTLPFEVQGAIAGFMTHRWQDNAEHVLQVALSDCEKLWIECSVRKVNLTEVDNHALWVMVRQVNDPRNRRVLPAAEYGQKELVERFKYQMLELILQEPDTASALEKLAKSIENVLPNSNCAIVLTSTTGHSIETVIAPTLSQSLLTTLGQLVVESGNGSIATAIKTRKRVIIDDVNVHPYWENHRHLALEAGFRSVWSEPIITMQGIVLGAFGIFYQEHKVPDVNEISTIMHAANLVSIIVDRHLSQDKIQSLAYREPVTGLPNRRRVYDVFQNLKTQQMTGHYWGLIYIDIDHFKWINEAHGHVSGNALLLEMAERLQGVVVPHFLACMGGDEFLILLSGLNHDALKAQQQVNDLRVKIQKQCNKPFCFGNQKLTMTVSMGIAVFSDQDMREQDCIKAVDIAMHRAKQAGRNTVCVYEPGMQTEIASKVQLEVALREAIAKQQFCLHYQVQVDHTGKAFGAEALLRWQHPTLGMISPANFISVAESSGLIVDIGMWVIEQACMQLAKWQKVSKTSELTLSVNISARQFKQDNFSSMVKNCIQRYALNPNALRFELTESLLLENVDDAVRIMGQLSELGIQFSLDDFGTGYSSLQYLKKLPLYQLKIDRSFVHDIVNDSHDRTIVRTIIAMAQSMYLSVIAEGVETREQMELLLNNGCRRYQGYYFGKPVPIEQFESQL